MSNGTMSHVPEEALQKETRNFHRPSAESESDESGSLRKNPYSSILEDLPDLLCLFRPDGRITYANAAFCRCFQKKKQETTGSMVYSYIPRKDRKRFAHQLETLAPAKPVRKFEYRLTPMKGRMQWHQWTLKAVFNESDTPVDYILAGRDITNLKSIEEDLIEALEKYATLFESTKDAIILIDKDRFIDCNTAALKTFRCKDKDGFLHSGFRDFSFIDLPAQRQTDMASELKRHFERALQRGAERFQWMCRRTDATVFPADIILSPFPLGPQKIMAAVIRDISDLKETEEALRKSREQYRELVENINDAIFSLDENGIITYTSPVIRKIIGYKPQEMTGRHFTDFVYSEDREAMKSRYSELLSGKIMSFEYRVMKKSGALCWLRAFNKPIMDGDRLRIYGVVTDITGQKKAEEDLRKAYDDLERKVHERTEELREINKLLTREIKERELIEKTLRSSEEQYRMKAEELNIVLNGITDIIMMQDISLNIIWANEAASGALNLPMKRLIGKKCHELWQGNSVPCDKCPVIMAVKTGVPQEETFRSDSGSIWQIMGYPVRDEQGTIRGAIEISRNITDKKHLEEELHKRYKLDSLGTLAGGIAHDFNNILTVILGNISFAKMLIDSQNKVYARLDDIEKASMKAKHLTGQLLTFSRGGSPLKKKLHLEQLLRDTAHVVLQGSDVAARFHTSADLLPVEADEAQIAQAIQNIIINARQALTGGGTISIEAANGTRPDDDPFGLIEGDYVKIMIKDTGCGIDETVLHNIFDPFFTTKKQSHGLGLATSYSIIRKHGGHITASSSPGMGTTVTVYLPALAETTEEHPCEDNETFPGKGRILFMDDEAFIRDLARSILSHLGYEVVFAREGNEAIEAYKKALQDAGGFDAVILDLTVVEGMGGKECIRELKKIDPYVTAIVSSGYSNDPIMSEPDKYGFAAFIAKPYNIQALSSVLKNTIEGGKFSREST